MIYGGLKKCIDSLHRGYYEIISTSLEYDISHNYPRGFAVLCLVMVIIYGEGGGGGSRTKGPFVDFSVTVNYYFTSV